MRAGFVLLALLGGLGIAVYLACWLIIPAADAGNGEARPSSAVVEVARACAACVGLGVLALLAGAATLFGFGWMIVGVAVAVLAIVFAVRSRVTPAWALLPIAALTLPAVAVAASGLKLQPQVGDIVKRPDTSTELSTTTYRSGLGTMLIDLRHASFPAFGTVPLRIDAGVRRTIVALPAGECVLAPRALAAIRRNRGLLLVVALIVLAGLWIAAGINHVNGIHPGPIVLASPAHSGQPYPFGFIPYSLFGPPASPNGWPWRVGRIPLGLLVLTLLSAAIGVVLLSDAVRVQIGLAPNRWIPPPATR
jgi:hypothetical protein